MKDKIKEIEKFLLENKDKIIVETGQSFLCMFFGDSDDLPQFQVASGSAEELTAMLLITLDSMRRSIGAHAKAETTVEFIAMISKLYLETAGAKGYDFVDRGFNSTAVYMPKQ